MGGLGVGNGVDVGLEAVKEGTATGLGVSLGIGDWVAPTLGGVDVGAVAHAEQTAASEAKSITTKIARQDTLNPPANSLIAVSDSQSRRTG